MNETRTTEWWNQQRSLVRELSREIFRKLDDQSNVDVGFLPRAYLDDFVAGVLFMVDLLTEVPPALLAQLATCPSAEWPVELAKLKPSVRRLCQLSRDVLFSIDAERVPRNLAHSIEKMFQLTGGLVPESADPELNEYRSHISGRKLPHSTSAAVSSHPD